MDTSFIPVPPRQVTIDDAAAFIGTTTDTIRGYHELGLLPETELRSDDRLYGYNEMIRLLWTHRTAEAGRAVDDIREAVTDTTSAGIRARLGLLSDFVSGRLTDLPEGTLRQADLDTLVVTEQIFGELGAAVQAGRFIALATHPGLREESDRLDAAEEALDDTISVDDPRVAQIAADRHAFELALQTFIEDSGQAQSDDALFDSWDAVHPQTDDDDVPSAADGGPDSPSATEAMEKMPYDFSPARLRCMDLSIQLAYPTPESGS